MADKVRDSDNRDDASSDLSRRKFIGMTVAAGIAAAAGTVSAQALPVVDTDVVIQTRDGMADCAFIHPTTGAHPGVIIWTDAFGLRPSFRDMGKRIAGEGYSVLVPNPFYRLGKAPRPVFPEGLVNFRFGNPADQAILGPVQKSINTGDYADVDTDAYVSWLDKQPQIDKDKKMGVQGYCMGGWLVVRTCAARPDRMHAGGSFHGGFLVTDAPNSPHRLAPKIKGEMYFGIGSNDDMRQPMVKDTLRQAFAAAHIPTEIEVYKSKHGWCVVDMPPDEDGVIYNMPEAEKAWGELVALYKRNLV